MARGAEQTIGAVSTRHVWGTKWCFRNGSKREGRDSTNMIMNSHHQKNYFPFSKYSLGTNWHNTALNVSSLWKDSMFSLLRYEFFIMNNRSNTNDWLVVFFCIAIITTITPKWVFHTQWICFDVYKSINLKRKGYFSQHEHKQLQQHTVTTKTNLKLRYLLCDVRYINGKIYHLGICIYTYKHWLLYYYTTIIRKQSCSK